MRSAPRSPFLLARALLCLGASVAACTELRGRSSADASRDLATEPQPDTPVVADATDAPSDVVGDASGVGFDARPCPASGLRVDGVVDRYYAADPTGMVGPFGTTAPRALTVDDRDGTYLAGGCSGCDAAARAVVWRALSSTGQSDPTWGSGGRTFDGDAMNHAADLWSLLRDDDGRLVAGGYSLVGGLAWPAVARFNSDGRADESFGEHGRVSLDPARFGGSLSSGYLLRALPSADGVLLVGVDEAPAAHVGTRAILARLRTDGTVDPTFADGGLLRRDDLRGCFDARRDQGDYVVLCQSAERRPVLLRLDDRGTERAWPSGSPIATHPAAPVEMQGRTLLRDSSGAWIVVGAVTRDYLDSDATPAAVRFTPGGAPDLAYGVAGLALLAGTRQTPRYTYASAAALACDDRLLVGANLDQQPLVAVLDRAGRLLRAVGDRGYLLLPVPRGATTAALTGIAALGDGSRAIVLTNFLPASFSLVSLGP